MPPSATRNDSEIGPGHFAGRRALDGSGAATLSGSWFFNDNWAIELWGTPDKFEQKVSLANGGRGTVKEQPIALSGQYFFGHAFAADPSVRGPGLLPGEHRRGELRSDGRRRPARGLRFAGRRDRDRRHRLQHQ